MTFKTIIGPEGAREIIAPLKSSFARKPGFDYDRVIDIAFHDLQEKFHLKNMNIFLLDSNDENLIGYRLFNPEIPDEINQKIYQMPIVLAEEPGVVKYILQNRIAVFVPELRGDMITSPWGKQIFEMTGMKSNLMLPLVIDDVVCGLITFPSYIEPLQFSKEQIEDIERRVLYISIALNAMFYAIELKEKNQIIEQKNQLQRDFMANVSHEIRTPMNAIIGFSGLARKTPLTPQQEGYLGKIESSAKTLLGIINDILDFSKIEAGKLALEAIPFHLDEVFDSVGDIISVRAAEKGLDVSISIDERVPVALIGDPLRLGQVLINLAGNAVKFTDTGRVQLRAELANDHGEEGRIRFFISDTGIGMTPEQISRLFSAFSQADTSVTRQYGGTGLGLSISKQLIELMGGQIRLESIAGKGSTFSFILPFVVQGDQDTAQSSINAGISDDEIARLAGARILLVEDNLLNQELASEILTDAGLQVSIAGNGAEAVAALTKERYDLVLMDSQMPVMGGFEATRKIRQELGLHELPIVAMTAHAMRGYREECLSAGMNDYISKPFDNAKLYATLARWIKAGARQLASTKTTASAISPIPTPLPQIAGDIPGILPGLDVAGGLARMNGKHALYKKLLHGFAAEYEQFPQSLRALIASNELDSACRALHALKGISGSLSIVDVYSATECLERFLKQGNSENCTPLLLALDEALRIACKSIATLEKP